LNKNIFIVPHDFSKASDKAMLYAVNISLHYKAQIELVHVIKEESERINAQLKMNLLALKFYKLLKIRAHVLIGDVIDQVAKFSKELNATSIVIGTSKPNRLKDIFGNFTLKLIISSHIPFIIVNEDYKIKHLDNVVAFIDKSIESLECVEITKKICHDFDSHLFVVSEKQYDDYQKFRITSKFNAIKKYLIDESFEFDSEMMMGNKSTASNLINYAYSVSADLICLAYDFDILFPANDKFSKDLVFNDFNIPILIMNSKSLTIPYN
jgi:nucleotide-binding universal stress UspA family protein